MMLHPTFLNAIAAGRKSRTGVLNSFFVVSIFQSSLSRAFKSIAAAFVVLACLGTAAWSATPTIDFPLNGDTLSGDTQTFLFNKRGLPVAQWWVHAGSDVGRRDYFNSGSLGAANHQELSGFPENGNAVYLRLWYRLSTFGSRWQFKDYRFVAQSPSIPKLTGPASFSEALTGRAVKFIWDDNGFGAESYKVGIGLEKGAELEYWWYDNLYHSGDLTTSRVIADGLIRYDTPAGGYSNYVYLGLYAKRPGEDYVLADYQIVKVYNASKVPSITTPAPDNTLTSTSATFNWTNNGVAVSQYWMYIGASLGGSEYYNSGNLGTSLSHVVNALPNDGSEVYVRLWYKDATGWKYSDEQYKASGVGPEITDPVPGGLIDDPFDTFSWTDNGVGVTRWWLTAGHNPGGREYYDSGNLGNATTVDASVASPDSGLSHNVRLWYRVGSDSFWRHTDYWYSTID